MTLRDFTEKHLKPIDARFTNSEPVWQKVFPTNLRWKKTVIKEGYYKGVLWLRWVEEEATKELEEQWVRIHSGQIIDREWRKVYTY